MNRLIILGNGFDISHSLNTRYTDFKKHFEETAKYYYDKFVDLYKEHDELLWSEFESVLGDLDYDQDAHACCDSYLYDYNTEDWSDSYHHDYENEMDNYISTLIDLRGRFKDWVKSINIETVNKKYEFKFDDSFLNFNYTMVLEKVYKIKNDNVLHIHGSIEDDGEIIVGHKNDYFERKIYKDDDYAIADSRVQGGIRNFNIALKSVYKPVEEIIENNIDFFEKHYDIIYVIGHSMSEVDIDYFKTIFSNNPKSKWVVSYHTDGDKENILKAVKAIGISEYELIHSSCIAKLLNG